MFSYWKELTELFQQVDSIHPDSFLASLAGLDLDEECVKAVGKALLGKLTDLNNWLFSLPADYSGPLLWIAPGLGSNGGYGWFIGKQPPSLPTARAWLVQADAEATSDSLLAPVLPTPPIIFFYRVAASEQLRLQGDDSDEFGLFQDSEADGEFQDVNKRLILNMSTLITDRKIAIQRAKAFFPQTNFAFVEENLELLALFHSEGHNRGHFLGPWPYVEGKADLAYEPLEEVRSCLAAIRLAEHAGLPTEFINALGVSVFVLRVFGTGYDAYHGDPSLAENYREATAGVLVWQYLRLKGVLQSDNNKPIRFCFDSNDLCKALLCFLREIHEDEANALSDGVEQLSRVARKWLAIAYPEAQYPLDIAQIYAQKEVIL